MLTAQERAAQALAQQTEEREAEEVAAEAGQHTMHEYRRDAPPEGAITADVVLERRAAGLRRRQRRRGKRERTAGRRRARGDDATGNDAVDELGEEVRPRKQTRSGRHTQVNPEVRAWLHDRLDALVLSMSGLMAGAGIAEVRRRDGAKRRRPEEAPAGNQTAARPVARPR